ncbi:neurogenic locus notch homolog protein 1-like, partial [Mizuhopecten yessoensis]|uniref:neurogenic locus notch homolog protein 1-like n=1 Tax=Mizuhopecten yessoensis TaxID=6573 RepID=UPI000B45EA5A
MVKVLRCPTIHNLPHQTINCPDGYRYGSHCNFKCTNGSLINGTGIATCEKESIGEYASWRWGDYQPFCEVVQLCKDDLRPPDNGAVACYYWLGGKFCQMLCRNGYDVPPGYIYSEMYVCGESGEWLPGSALPNCAKIFNSQTSALRMDVNYYFDGDCNNADVLRSIEVKFIQALMASTFKDACEVYAEKCHPWNVQIPSECDDHDDCNINQCNGGLCKDGLFTYSCVCPIGLKGDNCEINTDDCEDNSCENNLMCIDEIGGYTCKCDINFKGDCCEIAVVDGSWSSWGNWSVCSSTCGNGTSTRKRLCNNPTPDNGGNDCLGEATETIVCNMADCIVCTNLTTPANSVLVCNWNTTEDAVDCKLTCKDGYDFDHPAKKNFFCGPDTFHLWDFKTDDNAYGRLPTCTVTSDGCKDTIIQSLEEILTKKRGNEFNTFVDGVEYAVRQNSSAFGGKFSVTLVQFPYTITVEIVGQTSCISCPDGLTTEGRASTNL